MPMHELSIAISIVEIAEEEAVRQGAGVQIAAVHVRLGALAGVVKDALLFSYGIACENTPLAGSQLLVEEVPAVIRCEACGGPVPAAAPEWFRCARCGTLSTELVQGRELEVFAIEVAS